MGVFRDVFDAEITIPTGPGATITTLRGEDLQGERVYALFDDTGNSNNFTITVFGSLDDMCYEQLFFYELKDNIVSGLSYAKNSINVTGGTYVTIAIPYVLPYLQFRATKSTAPEAVKIKIYVERIV